MSALLPAAASQALLHLLWQGALVAGVLAALLQATPSRAARLRYALACAAMVLMLLLPALTAARSYTSLLDSARTSVEQAPPIAPPAVMSTLPAPLEGHPNPWPSLVAFAARNASQIVFLWLFGVLLGSARVFFGWLRLQKIVKAAEPVTAEWQQLLARICAALRVTRPVQLLASKQIDVPAAIGWLKPVVLVPISVLSGLPSEELSLVLAHELAHIRRHDYLVNLIQTAAETLLFYHPAVWWIGRVIRIERENCCDDLALTAGATPLAYARALTALETLRHGQRTPLATTLPAMSALGGSLPQRVQRLLLPSPRCASSWSIGTTVASLVLGLSLTIPVAARALPRYATAVFPHLEMSQARRAHTVATADSLTVDDLIALRQHGLTPERVRAFHEALPGALSVSDLVELADHGVTPDSVRAFNDIFGAPLDLDQVIALQVHGATPDYVRGLGALGFKNLTPDDVIEARAHGVTVEFARDLKASGVVPHTLQTVSELRASGIDGDYIQQMRAAGLGKASVEELQRLRANGITPDYLRKLRAK